MSARTFKLIGAAGAAALTVGVLAGPAVAADQVVNYTCNPRTPRGSDHLQRRHPARRA